MKKYRIVNMVASALTIAIIFMFMICEGFTPWTFTRNEMILSAFFPIGFIAGLIVGFFKQRIGGYITVTAFIGFNIGYYFISGKFPNNISFFVFALPGFSLLFYSLLIDYFNNKNLRRKRRR